MMELKSNVARSKSHRRGNSLEDVYPFSQRNLSTKRNSELVSLMRESFKPSKIIHAGMKKKPLVPYSPDSRRSRLSYDERVMPYFNQETLEIGDRSGYKSKTVFKTSYQTFMRPLHPFQSSNPGINSERTKWFKRNMRF